ncbi:MAG: FtsK/SpoIIIE domain-containing protein [Pauljensenia sp.]
MVGPRALEAALWWCAQVAARTGGAVVQVPPDGTVGQMRAVGGGAVPADAQGGEVEDLFVLGDGRTPVHVVDSDHCPHCEQDGGSHSGASAGAHSPLPGHDMEAAHPPTGTGTGTGTDRAAPVALHVGIAESYRGLPTWCDRVVEDPGPPISPLWWRQVARACATDPSAEGNQEGLPSRVLLAELTDLLTDPLLPQAGEADGGGPHASTSGPDEDGPTGLPALIGMGEGGPVTIDLVRDGPHALLAGTTGSGKSEALATWLLSLTGHHSPDRLRLVLIDYKGGAALRPFATLPHTEEVLTDLDPSATDRALTGLGALLVRREREMADVGVPDLARWELAHAQGRAPTPPPRVLVVVDEFRILADSHPSTLEALVRLAAQGRSLGLHLIAATQRPAGALTPAMRANVEIRLALRCAEEVDSLDVLGSALAARLPRLPGRAVLRGGGILQIAWVPDIDREVAEVAHRWARRPADDDPPGTSCAHGTAGDDTRAHAACADAGPVDRTGATSFPTPGPGRDMLGSRARLWAPDLPGHCSWVDVPGMQLPVSGSGDATTLPPPLPVALADRISGTSQGPLLWRSGGVSVEGPAHRTTELETVALALGTRIAAGRGLPLHVCSGAPTRPPGCATWIRPDDPGPVAMLLEGVLQHGPAVLVTTDIQTMNEGIDLCLGPGQGRAWWGRILSCADRAGVVLIVARTNDAAGAVGGGTPHLPHRLIHVGNSEEALRSGLPSSVPTSLLPGRVLVRGFDEDASGNLRCQVPLEPYPTVATPLAPTPAHAAPPWCVRSEPGGDEPLPDWALGWAGPELLPLKVPGDLDWVVVAADPGPALARLAALRGRGEDSAPPTPDAVHVPRATARPQVAPTHGVTVVHPDQWPTLHALGSRPLIALDPGAELVRMLAASLRGVPPSLRAMEWGPRCGVLAHAGKLTRLVLPPR